MDGLCGKKNNREYILNGSMFNINYQQQKCVCVCVCIYIYMLKVYIEWFNV